MFNIIECTIEDIKNAFINGELDSYTLTKMYLDRIATIDQGKIKYNSILEVNPDCLFEASLKDAERMENKAVGLLHGIPIVLKDNINTKGKMHTTAGSLALKGNFAPYDAFIVRRLKEEGAIILGKANLTEFANFMSINMRNGYSSVGKEVLCPFNIDIDPSGSSAGSAVSVSINLSPISIGTETDGSIIGPSMQNGVVGLKPTMGLISRTGIIPISSTLDTPGPIAKSVYDCAVLLGAIRGNDLQDPITLVKENKTVDYTEFIKDINPTKLRVGLDKSNYESLTPLQKKAFDNVVDQLQKSGVTIIENLDIKQTEKIYFIMLYEFKRVLNHYLSTLGTASSCRTLSDVVKFNNKNKKHALKYGQILLKEALNKTSGRCNESKYIDALSERDIARVMLKKIYDENSLDAIYFASYTSLGPHSGYPTMTVPIRIGDNNIPIGCYLLGNEYREDKLLKVGRLIESIVKGRINPLE